MRTMSPSRSAASGPPSAASGTTWATMKPWVAPEKRPSVTRATELSRPAPASAAGHREHLLHPRPAHRPLVADDHHVAGLDLPLPHPGEGLVLGVEDPGGPAVGGLVVAGQLDDAASGGEVAAQDGDPAVGSDRLGRRAGTPPAPGSRGRAAAISARVRPSTLRASPWSRPRLSRRCISTASPPARWMSVATNRPPGRRSARIGVRAQIAWKSSMSSGTSASAAMARRWSTALVEPPVAEK